MAHYLDTSALVKLVVAEAESAALTRWLATGDVHPIASDLARTELIRTVRRHSPGLLAHAVAVVDAIEVQAVTRTTFETAALIDPLPLRSLDAIHLACALTLAEDLDSIVTYDVRLGHAAVEHGLTVLAPS